EIARACWGVDLMLQYVTANAAEHSVPTPSDIDSLVDVDAAWDDLTRALRAADPASAPHIASHVDNVLAGTPTQRVDWALRTLIAGIRATPTLLTH
ncbi:hypothetical protein, partial [Salinibacterium sp.]|uniref:hypothetical protein n=1 Tax=Salinibacterium sp. TaxID=1915057 RepID=UPI0037CB4A7F